MRTVTASMVAAFQSASGAYTHLVSLEFSSGTTYLTPASNNVDFGGNTYVAIGGTLDFDPITEGKDLRAQGMNLVFDGGDQTTISSLLSDNVIGRAAKVYLAHFGSDGSLVADPLLLFDGILNGRWSVRETRGVRGSAKVTIRVLSPFSRFKIQRGIRMSVASHSSVTSPDYSAETIMSHVAALKGKNIVWGRSLNAVDTGQDNFPPDIPEDAR